MVFQVVWEVCPGIFPMFSRWFSRYFSYGFEESKAFGIFKHFFELELPCHVHSWSRLGGFIASFPMVGMKPVQGAAYRIPMGPMVYLPIHLPYISINWNQVTKKTSKKQRYCFLRNETLLLPIYFWGCFVRKLSNTHSHYDKYIVHTSHGICKAMNSDQSTQQYDDHIVSNCTKCIYAACIFL